MDKQFFHLTQIRELPTGEFVRSYSTVISILEDVEHGIDSPEFKAVSQKVMNNYVDLDKLDRKILGTVLTSKISDLHKTRVALIRYVKSAITTQSLSDNINLAEHLHVLKQWFKAHSSALPGGRQDAVTRSLEELTKVMLDNQEFIDAALALDIDDAVNNLIEANNAYIKVYKQRSVLWGGDNVPDIDANKIKRESLKDLKMLINNISINASLNPESCYSLVRALRKESNRVRTIVLRAQTLRRQAKLENDGVSVETAAAIYMVADDNSGIAPASMPAEVNINKPAEAMPKTVMMDAPKSEEEKNTHEDSIDHNEEAKKIS